MRAFLINIYFILKSAFLNIFKKDIKISLSAKIRPHSVLDGCNRIGKETIFKGKLSNYSYIGNNCDINASVGKFTSIGDYVYVVTAQHPINYASTSPIFYSALGQCVKKMVKANTYIEENLLNDNGLKVGALIGNDCWIGSHVIIKGGVTIGNGSIVAMGSVVVKDVEPYSIVGGNPAKLIKKRFTDKEVSALENSKWWNRDYDKLKLSAKYVSDIEGFINYGK